MEDILTEGETRELLDTLCVTLGFCLAPQHARAIVSAPPNEVTAFVDAVFRAEGIEPAAADRHLYRRVREKVAVAFGE